MKNLTSKGYELLLAELDGNPAKADDEYKSLHLKLTYKFMREDRGRWNADNSFLADDTLDRVAKYLEAGNIAEKGVCVLALGIARIVWLNYMKKNPMPVEFEPSHEKSYQMETEEETNARILCLRSCLVEICKNDEERKNLLEYYRQSDNKLLEQRKLIAERLEMTTNTLKTKMCRLRDKLRECINDCLKKQVSV